MGVDGVNHERANSCEMSIGLLIYLIVVEHFIRQFWRRRGVNPGVKKWLLGIKKPLSGTNFSIDELKQKYILFSTTNYVPWRDVLRSPNNTVNTKYMQKQNLWTLAYKFLEWHTSLFIAYVSNCCLLLALYRIYQCFFLNFNLCFIINKTILLK